MKGIKIIFLILLVIVLIAALNYGFGFVEFREDILSSVGSILGSLLIITLLMERALDVFLTTWRADESEKLDKEINDSKQTIAALKAAGKTEKDSTLNTELNNLKMITQKKMTHRSKTRVIALWSALILGVVLSAIGFRILASLLDPESLKAIGKNQLRFFNFFDILLTGGLIAGGSDGIHKVMDLYRVFMETSSTNIKSKEKTQPAQ